MGDVGDTFKALKEMRKEQKKEKISKINEVYEKLNRAGLDHETKNNGVHIILSANGKRVADLWPSTNKFFNRLSGRYGYGLDSLVKQLIEDI